MAVVPRAGVLDIVEPGRFVVFVFGYDRAQLHDMEFLFMLARRPFYDRQGAIAFYNENGLWAGMHGFVDVQRVGPRNYELNLGFSCLGADVWAQSQSWTRVTGSHDWLEGRDSQMRTVRMALLAVLHVQDELQLVQLAAPLVDFLRTTRRLRLWVDQLPYGRAARINAAGWNRAAPPALRYEDFADWVWL